MSEILIRGDMMISPFVLKMIEHLPKGIVAYFGKSIFNRYIKKYTNISVEGMENIKDVKRPVIFICNHMSNSDGLIVEKVLKKEDITFVAGIKLGTTALTNLGLAVSRTISIKPNTADKEAIKKVINTLKDGKNIFIFPEGTRSRTGGMIEAKKGVILFQRMAKVPVIPIGMTGTENFLPINDNDMGAEKFSYADIHVNFGAPIYYDELPPKNDDEDKHSYEKRLTDYLMYKIAELLPKKYRGFYDKEV